MTDTEYILKNFSVMPDKVLAKNLNIDINRVRRIRYKNGLMFCKKPYQRATMHSLETNAKCYEMWIGGLTCAEIGRQLKLRHEFVSSAISRFLPQKGATRQVLVRLSKV